MLLRSRLRRCIAFQLIIVLSVFVLLQIQQYRLAIVGWDISVSRNISDYIFPNVSTTLIKPNGFCNSQSFLVVFICSSPSNFDARKVIRQSWGLSRNISNAVVNVYFIVGLTTDLIIQEGIESESKMYNDILQENFIDSYNNLTLKSLMVLKLVINDCQNKVRYIMKTDDDVFVNSANLIDRLQNIQKKEEESGVLFGYLMCNVEPVRLNYEKWFVPMYMYEGTKYPNYLSGTGYVMSANVGNRLFEIALETPLIHLEDVYLTGICAKRAGIRPRHNLHFNFKRVPYNPCYFKHLITTHSFSPTELLKLYHSVNNNFDLESDCVEYMQTIKKNVTALKQIAKFNKKHSIHRQCY